MIYRVVIPPSLHDVCQIFPIKKYLGNPPAVPVESSHQNDACVFFGTTSEVPQNSPWLNPLNHFRSGWQLKYLVKCSPPENWGFMIQFDERASFLRWGWNSTTNYLFLGGGFGPEDRVSCTHGGAGWEILFDPKKHGRLRLPEAPVHTTWVALPASLGWIVLGIFSKWRNYCWWQPEFRLTAWDLYNPR